MPRCGALPLYDTTLMKGAQCRIARASVAALRVAVFIPIPLSCNFM